jgi:uncharacterized protein (TIGR02466 family)
MTRHVLPLFATPIHLSFIDIDEAIKNEIYNTPYDNRKVSYEPKVSSNKNLLNDGVFLKLKESILKEFEYYKNEVLQIKKETTFKMTHSWSVLSEPNNRSDLHHHSNAFFSGVVYIKIPKNSGNICFYNTNENLFPSTFSALIEKENYNTYNSQHWSIEPEENMLLLFPAILGHDVKENLSRENRFSLSFDFFPNCVLGQEQHRLDFTNIN